MAERLVSTRNVWLKPVVFIAALLPLARLGWKGLMGDLGANPIQVITFSTGTPLIYGAVLTALLGYRAMAWTASIFHRASD